MSEEYSVGYSEGYQAGWNAAIEAALPAQPAPVQEPEYEAAWHKVWPDAGSFVRASSEDLIKFAKAIAAQRQWVGLTDEEIRNFINAPWGDGVTVADFIRAIEAKLKEKNT